MADLQNSYILGVDKYLRGIEEAYDLMLGYSHLVGSASNIDKNIKDLYTTGVSFYQALNNGQEQPEDGSNGKIFQSIKCFSCGNKGHYADECPHSGISASYNDKESNKETKKANTRVSA